MVRCTTPTERPEHEPPLSVLLEVELPRAAVDEASGLLWSSGSITAIEETAGPGGQGAMLRAGMSSLVDASRALSILGDRWPARVVAADAEEWIDDARAMAETILVGDGIVLVPPGRDHVPEPEQLVVSLDAGGAFGNGAHPTTRMALAALERWVGPDASVLDVGCGTGVLAVVAAMLGSPRVVALDVDPEALAVARTNVDANGVGDRVTLDDLPVAEVDDRYDIVVANLTAGTVIDLATVIVSHAEPDGIILLTGVLDRRGGEVTRAYESLGCSMAGYNEDHGWTLLELRRS